MLDPRPLFIVPLRRELKDRRFYRIEIWRPARREHPDIGSRREWLDALTLLYDYADHIMHRDGAPYAMPDIDSVFPDLEMRWFSYFLQAESCGTRPKSYSRKYDRLEVIHLFCRVRAYDRLR